MWQCTPEVVQVALMAFHKCYVKSYGILKLDRGGVANEEEKGFTEDMH